MSEAIHDLLKGPRPNALFVSGECPLDENVAANLPKGTRFLSANKFGTSIWTITARIDVEFPNGAQAQCFLKCAAEDRGGVMMEGEYNAMSKLYKTMPNFVPKPMFWGKHRVGNPDTFYLPSDFIDMNEGLPEPNQLCSKLAQLHRRSVSPTSELGMHTTTCQGRTPQAVFWESSWTKFFSNLLQHVVDLDFETNGYWEELHLLEKRLFESVIPRLIGALDSDGRSIKPCLIHGDLWEGNTGTSSETGDIYVFDSGAFYAHNEMEIGNWRGHYNKIHDEVYTRTYL